MTSEPQNDPVEEPEIVIEDTPVEEPKKGESGESGRVEFETPEQQQRFNDVYKQAKMADKRNKFLLEANQLAIKRIEELESRFNQTDHAEAERILQTRIKESLDEGDTEKAAKIMTELADFKARSVKPEVKEVKKPEVQDFGIPAGEVNYIQNAVFEQDDTGNYVRPWLHQSDPRYSDAIKHAEIISHSVQHELGTLDVVEVMNRLEKVMDKKSPRQPNGRSPDPMGGNLTNRSPRNTLKLSSQEAEIARKLGISEKVYAQSRDNLRKGR